MLYYGFTLFAKYAQFTLRKHENTNTWHQSKQGLEAGGMAKSKHTDFLDFFFISICPSDLFLFGKQRREDFLYVGVSLECNEKWCRIPGRRGMGLFIGRLRASLSALSNGMIYYRYRRQTIAGAYTPDNSLEIYGILQLK